MKVPNQINCFPHPGPQTCSSFWNPHLNEWYQQTTQEGCPLRAPSMFLSGLSPPTSTQWSSHRAFTYIMSLVSLPYFLTLGPSSDTWFSSLEHEPGRGPPLDLLCLVWPPGIHSLGTLQSDFSWLSKKKQDTGWRSTLVKGSRSLP